LPGNPEAVRDMAPYHSGVLIGVLSTRHHMLNDESLGLLAVSRAGDVTRLATMPQGGADIAVAADAGRYYAVSGAAGQTGWLASGEATGGPTLRKLPPSINDPDDVV